ncbi:MAG: FkbM family methyltransferase [Rikenellaceae bacterium]|nr:FkbM family methyltransferase [Rikenellaceae bacterium]
MGKLFHRILYRLLSLENYLRVVSRMFFLYRTLGLGRGGRALEYVYHLPQLVKQGDKVIDIGANLGYYTCPLADLVGEGGKVYAVEPVPVIFSVLKRNVGKRKNVELLNYALGEEERAIEMANDSVASAGYFGTGRNFVSEGELSKDAVRFTAQMKRGSELFKGVEKIDFIKCDIEGYERVVLPEMRPLIERHHPTVLVETDGESRQQMIAMFTELGYSAYMLVGGKEVTLDPESDKDIIFRFI